MSLLDYRRWKEISMIRFIAIIGILLWSLLLLAGSFLYVNALVLGCEGQYFWSTFSFVLSIAYILEFIDDANQIPSYFYQIIHNHWKHEDYEVAPLMIWKEKQ